MLELRDIAKQWDHRPLLAGVNLRVAAGETVALLGPSGSGKSTLLKIVAGLEAPEAGSVWFESQDITNLPPERRGFALMFQDFALFPHLNVQDNVAFGLIEQGVPRRSARERAKVMLERLGLGEHTEARVWTLSGGEQQRVGLARALMLSAARWAEAQGSRWIAVAVTEANAPARALYAGLGMAEAARYHYRAAPGR